MRQSGPFSTIKSSVRPTQAFSGLAEPETISFDQKFDDLAENRTWTTNILFGQPLTELKLPWHKRFGRSLIKMKTRVDGYLHSKSDDRAVQL